MAKTIWTTEEEELLKQIFLVTPQKELITYFPNRPLKSITSKASRLGLVKYSQPCQAWSARECQFLKDHHLVDSIDYISTYLKRSKSSIQHAAQRLNLTQPMEPKVVNNKQTIIEMYEQGKEGQEIADIFEVDKSSIWKYLRKWGASLRHRVYNINENFFSEIDSAGKSYFLGFLFADGNVYTKRNCYVMSLSLQERDGYILDFLGGLIFEDAFPLYRRVSSNPKRQDQLRLRVESKQIVNDLMKHKCKPNKTFTAEFPETLLAEFLPDFLRGYFDGDGCIYLGKHCRRWNIIGAQTFINGCSGLLSELGISHRVYKSWKSEVYILDIGRMSELLKIINYIYTPSMGNLYLRRKYEKCMLAKNHILKCMEGKEPHEQGENQTLV